MNDVTSTLGVVVGMPAEARLVSGSGCVVGVGGGTPVGARRIAQKMVSDGVTALISFGFAGGLDPAWCPGTVLVPEAVLVNGRLFDCDESLRAALPGERIPCLLAADAVVALADEKRRLWRTTGAGAVDLESGAVAEVAASAGIPFAVLRAVLDPAGRDLPSAATSALDQHGRVMVLRMASILTRHPMQILGLIALARDASRARKALIGSAESLRRLAAGDTDLRGLGL